MKNSILLSLMFVAVSSVALAQTRASESSTTEMSTTATKPAKSYSGDNGFSVSAEYVNFTEWTSHIENEKDDVRTTDNKYGTDHLGMTGFKAGYNRTPDRGLGFNAGLTYLSSLNKNETDFGKVELWIAQGNLTGAFNRLFTGYVGGNISKFSTGFTDTFKPSVGMQLGLGVRPVSNLSVNAGYMLISQYVDEKYSDSKTTGLATFGGFNTNLTYTF